MSSPVDIAETEDPPKPVNDSPLVETVEEDAPDIRDLFGTIDYYDDCDYKEERRRS